MAPMIVMMIAMTAAKIGRSMKKRDRRMTCPPEKRVADPAPLLFRGGVGGGVTTTGGLVALRAMLTHRHHPLPLL
jgi:hypothetical protein